ncbi:MAG TPA: hypothetical protein VFE78_20400 [Gemmataceae bacterium]|nr:hypothetical protein [Gemmataceae bacterium]
MRTALELLNEAAGTPGWPPRWLTVDEVAAELERRGLWERPPLRAYAGQARLDFLAGALPRAGHPAWAQLGRRFKPAVLLTEADHALLRDWLDEYNAALNEDLARILLGEPALGRRGTPIGERGA